MTDNKSPITQSRSPHAYARIKKVLIPAVVGLLSARSASIYNKWLKQYRLTQQELEETRIESEKFSYRPLISVVVPVYNTPEDYLREMVESVRLQTYSNWELVLVDDASPEKNIKKIMTEYAQIDSRIIVKFLDKNHHISGATNEGIKVARGEFISLLDHDDILWPEALYEITKVLGADRNLNFIYTDEDKIDTTKNNAHLDPFFKPDYNPDFLRSVNYITHFTTIRKTVLNTIGLERNEYNGAQDWELFLRVTRNIPPASICHIPKILYSWRVHSASTSKSFDAKPYVIESQRLAITSDLSEKGSAKFILNQDKKFNAQWRLEFINDDNPSVTVLVPKNISQEYEKELNNIDYKDLKIVKSETSKEYFNEETISHIDTDYAIFLFEPLTNIDKKTIENLLGDASRDEIAFVSTEFPKKGYKRNIESLIDIKYIKLLEKLGARNITSHLYRTTRYNVPFMHEQSCVMIKTNKLKKAKSISAGRDDLKSLSTTLCKEHGYWNLYNPYA